jgi:hypothetical protein
LRARFDPDPPDLQRDEDVDWLRALVWSGDRAREHLEAAIRVARRARPCLVCGDLRTDLAAVARLGATWIANESPRVLPDVAARASRAFDDSRFLVSLDGEPVALAAPHGQMLEWIGT